MRRWISLLLLFCITLSLSGCMMLNSSDLLTLPEISPEHRQLLKLVNAETASAAWATTNPVSGDNRLTMQFVDFYGDGIPEAVAFFRNQKEFRLRTALYTKTGAASYTSLCTFDLPGDQFHRIDYADLDGDGSVEMLVSVRLDTAAVYALYVYAIRNGSALELLQATYTDLAVFDLDGDGACDILLVNGDETSAELFSCENQTMVSRGKAPLSEGTRVLSNIRTGFLNETMPAAVADAAFTDATGAVKYLSDVFVCEPGGELKNLSYAEVFHQSFETQRTVPYAFSDADFDGYLEFPIAIPSVSGVTGGQYIRWYGYQPDGSVAAKSDTFHHSSGAWYFLLPASWRDTAGIRELSTATYNVVVFSYTAGGMVYELLTLYLFPSEEAMQEAKLEGIAATVTYNGSVYAIRLPKKPSGNVPADLYLSGVDEAKERLVFLTAAGGYARASRINEK